MIQDRIRLRTPVGKIGINTLIALDATSRNIQESIKIRFIFWLFCDPFSGKSRSYRLQANANYPVHNL